MNKSSLFVFSILTGMSLSVQAEPTPLNETTFKQCLIELQQSAIKGGVSQKLTEQTVSQLKLQPKVIELDRRQPEFTQTFAGYLNARVTDWRVLEGRKLLEVHRTFLDELTKKYGIPAQYLLAFWGMETNFGRYKGKMPVLDSLATLACDHRRNSYFTQEFIQALKLMEKYQFTADQLQGSWAGAMGHTQFMPTAYNNYAVDADGDGKPDLWNSTRDALASAANFLQQLGWQRNERWGREVVLPKDFDYSLAGEQHARTVKEWHELGLKMANGDALPELDMKAVLYIPAGYKGPAFLAYGNFDVIMRWNRSVFYAISVGHLANRIAGGGHLNVMPPEHKALTRQQIKSLQTKLTELGFDVGEADGVWGQKSMLALRLYQKEKGLIADGFPHGTLLQALKIE